MGFIDAADFRVLHQEHEITIEASRERVWSVVTEQIGEWWPKSFLTSESTLRFVLEPVVGGRLYEDWGDGQGLLWGNVVALRRPELLQVTGQLLMDHSCASDHGPAEIVTIYRLEGDEATTVLKLTDIVYGRVGDDVAKSLEGGWRHILHECLKPFIEKG